VIPRQLFEGAALLQGDSSPIQHANSSFFSIAPMLPRLAACVRRPQPGRGSGSPSEVSEFLEGFRVFPRWGPDGDFRGARSLSQQWPLCAPRPDPCRSPRRLQPAQGSRSKPIGGRQKLCVIAVLPRGRPRVAEARAAPSGTFWRCIPGPPPPPPPRPSLFSQRAGGLGQASAYSAPAPTDAAPRFFYRFRRSPELTCAPAFLGLPAPQRRTSCPRCVGLVLFFVCVFFFFFFFFFFPRFGANKAAPEELCGFLTTRPRPGFITYAPAPRAMR